MWKIKRFISPPILWTNKFALFCWQIGLTRAAMAQKTSYVAERQGGGPQDLLRRFDSSRNCKKWLPLAGSDFVNNG